MGLAWSVGVPLTSWVALGKSLSLSGPVCPLLRDVRIELVRAQGAGLAHGVHSGNRGPGMDVVTIIIIMIFLTYYYL